MPEIFVRAHAYTCTFCTTCLWYYSTRQLNLFLALRCNLGIVEGAQGPPAFMLECLLRNSLLGEGITETPSPTRDGVYLVIIGACKSLGAISVLHVP